MSVKQILKKLGIVMASVTILYLLILLIAGMYLNSQKDSIHQKFETVLKDKLNGTFKIGKIDISVWKHFPAIGFRMENFTLLDSVYHRPIISAKVVATRFSLFALLSSHKTVNDIIIEDASFHLFTDSTGYTNKYLLSARKMDPATSNQKNRSAINIESLQLKNLDIVIEDAPKFKRIAMLINKLEAHSKQSGKIMKVKVDEDISMKQGLGFKLTKGAYLENQRLTGKWSLLYNEEAGTLAFGDTKIKISNHPFVINGNFVFSEKPVFKLHVQSKDLTFELAKAIVTKHIRQKAVNLGMEILGTIDAEVSIEGTLLPNTNPAVNLNCKTVNSRLKTRFTNVDQCSFSANFMNSIHPDSIHDDANSKLSLLTFSCNWDGVNIKGKDIVITNLKTPQLQFKLHSDCNLKDLDNKFAINKIKFLSGSASLDVSYDGPMTEDKSMFQDIEGN
jgi:hypothetical protein